MSSVDERRKIIVVSNRGPVTFRLGANGAREASRGGGGLVTALASLAARHSVTWIASAMSSEDIAVAREAGFEAVEETAFDGSTYRLRLVVHDPSAYNLFYRVVANPTLWFLQHYLFDLARGSFTERDLEQAWNAGYIPVNEAFAAAVLAELERDPEAVVFFHDYHLYLAPRLVRAKRPQARLSHFVHIPWPQSDYWHILPDRVRTSIHDGLLANDVVGFHTDRWRKSFLRSAQEIVGAEYDAPSSTLVYGGRQTLVTARPISVDIAEFEGLKTHPKVLEHGRAIAQNRPEQLVLRVDRTDPSKNIVRGFRAFELLLESYPELHERVGMLALLDPSRQEIPEYAAYLTAIKEEAKRINDRFRRGSWSPIDLQIHDDFHQSVAAFKQYDVLLVNAIFDGLNLVAKEAPLVNERNGVLVLSENTGAYEEIGRYSIPINPFDIRGQAEAIHEALTMDERERERRIVGLREYVSAHDIEQWISAQLSDLDDAR